MIAINMENLDKIRSPVGICEGFNLNEFDRVILVRLLKVLNQENSKEKSIKGCVK